MSQADLSPSTRPRQSSVITEYLGLAGALVLLVIIFACSTDHFFSRTNFLTIANQIPAAVIMATGMTLILIIAAIDLSVGSVMGLCSSVLGVCMVYYKGSLALGIAATLATGVACGLFNGLISVRFALPSFIVTLGMLEIARGGAHFITKSQTQYIGSAVGRIAETSVLGLSFPFILAVAIVAAGQLLLSRTVFGRYLVAIGTNEEAVRLSGIDPRPIKLSVFVLTGLLVALAAIIDTSRFQVANPNAGNGSELKAIAAVVIGGTSLMGGRGSVIGSFFGVLIIAVLDSGLAAVGAKDETKRLITGLVIVGAVIMDQYRHRWQRARQAI